MMTSSGLILPSRPSPGVLVTPGGVPVVPQWLQQETHDATGGRARVEWIAGAHTPYYGLKVRWRTDDPRWEHVRTGQMAESSAFDLEKIFPRDCSPEDIAAYLRANWGERNSLSPDQAAKEAERIADASVRSQGDARTAAVDALVQKGTDQHLSESNHTRRVHAGAESAHPMVSGGFAP